MKRVTAGLASLALIGAASVVPITGMSRVSSGADVKSLLQPSWGTGAIPAGDDGDPQGAFRFLCAPSHNAYDDPIVYPRQPGKSHLHTFFGNTGTNARSTYTSLRKTGGSTCNNILNRSAYWIAAMMNRAGKVVMPDWLAVYYKRFPKGSPMCAKVGIACVDLPRGLRYIYGYDMIGGKHDPARARWWNCDAIGVPQGHYATIAEAAKGCPAGGRIGAILFGPDCWNGRDYDSRDHRSHMAFSEYRGQAYAQCPATHPYVIPTLQLGAWYTNDGTAEEWRLASDMGLPGGTTLHADWFGAWEDSILSAWSANCLDKRLSCNSGDLGDGRQMKMTAGYSFPNKTVLVDPPLR